MTELSPGGSHRMDARLIGLFFMCQVTEDPQQIARRHVSTLCIYCGSSLTSRLIGLLFMCQVSRGLQLQSLWRVPTAAVS